MGAARRRSLTSVSVFRISRLLVFAWEYLRSSATSSTFLMAGCQQAPTNKLPQRNLFAKRGSLMIVPRG